MWSKAAYLLVIVCFVTIPLHFVVHRRHFLQSGLAYFSLAVFLFALLVAFLHRPRDARLGICAFLAWLIHGVATPSI